MEGVAVERRKIRLRMSLSNLMEFKKEVKMCPCDYKKYPKDWKLRSRFIRQYRAKNRCELCGALNYQPHPITGARVILTVAHIYNHDPMCANLLNLKALCQLCHNRLDAKERRRKLKEKRLIEKRLQSLFIK